MAITQTHTVDEGPATVLLNGEDVSNRTFKVELTQDGRGFVHMYEEPMRIWMADVCDELRYGQVEFRPR